MAQVAVAVPGAALRSRDPDRPRAQQIPDRQLDTMIEFCESGWTIMNSVIEHGTALVEDPDRVGRVSQLGIDETRSWPPTTLARPSYAAGPVYSSVIG